MLAVSAAPAFAEDWPIAKKAGITSGFIRCVVASPDLSLVITTARSKSDEGLAYFVYVGSDRAMTTKIHVLVDGRHFEAQRDAFPIPTSGEIVAALRQADEVAVEWTSSADEVVHERVLDLGGFAEQLAACEAWVKGR